MKYNLNYLLYTFYDGLFDSKQVHYYQFPHISSKSSPSFADYHG
jgi:hypothetical protein